MADAQSDWPEQERTLRALFRWLKACMILTWERQEKISCYRLHDLKMNFEEENPGYAQEIFDDDMAQAEQAQVLKRRAVVVAHLVGEAMSSYARSHSPLDDPWMAWRREPADEPAGEFVHSL